MPELSTCPWSCYGVKCGQPSNEGSEYCLNHDGMKCVCGNQTTEGCSYCGQFVCGRPICPGCEGFEDRTRPSGNWGFLNHSHRKKVHNA